MSGMMLRVNNAARGGRIPELAKEPWFTRRPWRSGSADVRALVEARRLMPCDFAVVAGYEDLNSFFC